MIRVLLADDHALVRQGLVALLEGVPGIEVVGEAEDGMAAVSQAEVLKPDVMVLDMAMPGLNGLEAVPRIRNCSPKTRVIILSMYDDEEYVVRAIQQGVSGYILKRAISDELIATIREVHRGHLYLGRLVANDRLRQAIEDLGQGQPVQVERLTPREREILILVAEGHTSQQIADRLGISVKTVENHRARLMEKLALRTLAELTRYAIVQGWVR
ncbi:MAG: response regulator [Candidatus Bipolaricaulia bacterium]